MLAPDRRTEFESRLLEALTQIGVDVTAWVVLPNHYHILVGVDTLESVSGALKQLHGTTSREWNLADNQTGKRRVWYKFSDRLIRDEAHYYRALNYIHLNPVKHGYVSASDDWPWLSLANYLAAQGRDWLQEKWQAYPPGDFGKGWDD